MTQTLVITGLFSPLGRRMARLAVGMGVRVLGIDIKPLTKPFPDVEFVQTDIRNPLLAELCKTEKVDTILHCAFRWRQRHVEEIFDSNVLGTIRLLGAAETAGVRKIILPSSTFVYGAVAGNPAFLGEDSDFKGRPHYAYVGELREIETFVKGFRHHQPQVVITVLRFANLLGGGLASPLARYLSLPAAPTLLGFEPMLQVLHYDDALRVLRHCLQHDYDGVFNIAAPPPLPLYQLLALARVPPIMILHPLATQGLQMGRMFSHRVDALVPIPWDFLRYSWVADTTRMKTTLGFTPTLDAKTTVQQWRQSLRQHRQQNNRLTQTATETWQDIATMNRKSRATRQESSRRLARAMAELRGRDPATAVKA